MTPPGLSGPGSLYIIFFFRNPFLGINIATSDCSQTYQNKTFNPFSDIINNDNETPLTYEHFDSVRKKCTYYNPCELYKLDFANQIAMIHINTRSMVNKFDEIKTLLSTTVKWNFIFVSETWLTKDIEKFYLLEGYQSFLQAVPINQVVVLQFMYKGI